jgi:hypothetical protein
MKAPSPKPGRKTLAIVLACSMFAAGWVMSREQSPDDIRPARADRATGHAGKEAPSGSAHEELDIDRIGRATRPATGEVMDIFERRAGQPEAQSEAAPPPQAPSLPFSYVGKMVEDGAQTIFLSRQDQNYVVKVGDTLDRTYRIARIDATTMTFIYLPLGQRQLLQIGE